MEATATSFRTKSKNSDTFMANFRAKFGDNLFFILCLLAALSVFVIIGAIFLQTYYASLPSIHKFGFSFLTTSQWDPVNDNYGALPFIYGTLVTSFLALLLSLPLSLGVAIFLVELASLRVRTVLSFLVEILAAIPSIVYGLWGVFVLGPAMQSTIAPFLMNTLGWLPFFKGPAYGVSQLSAGVILAIMILPIITSISRDILLAIPMSQREASLALGGTKWEAAKIALANARWGIFGGVILGFGRALGETMAVTMVIGNSPTISASLLQPGYTMASVLANEFTEATSDMYISALIEVGLVLLGISFVINVISRIMVWGVTKRLGDSGGKA